MVNRQLLRRTQILILILVFLTVMFLYFLLKQSASVPGLSSASDELRKSTIEKQLRAETTEGRILDGKGVVLSEGKNPGENGLVVFPEAYSWLLGYNSARYGAYGLRGKYENYLYMPGKKKKGADITLTIDNDLQLFANDLISGTEGSLIVMEVKTGKILALASSKEAPDPDDEDSFNVNELTEENMEKWSSIDGYFVQNGYKDQQEPGSVFKPITASVIIENNKEDEIVNDQGTVYIGSHEIGNAGDVPRGKISLQEALGYSSNVYFATMGVELGGVVLREKAESFLLGKDIALDFTTLKSNFDLGNYNYDLLADTAYGQGKTLITPLHIAMVYQSIANNGMMKKPYLIKKIELDGKSLYKGKSDVLTEPLSQNTAQKLDNMLKTVASEYYGISDSSIRAKTGTAQIPGSQKLYFASYNDKYVVVASKVTDDGYGRKLMGMVLDVYKYLEKYN